MQSKRSGACCMDDGKERAGASMFARDTGGVANGEGEAKVMQQCAPKATIQPFLKND
jgi:hypothetical protein